MPFITGDSVVPLTELDKTHKIIPIHLVYGERNDLLYVHIVLFHPFPHDNGIPALARNKTPFSVAENSLQLHVSQEQDIWYVPIVSLVQVETLIAIVFQVVQEAPDKVGDVVFNILRGNARRCKL